MREVKRLLEGGAAPVAARATAKKAGAAKAPPKQKADAEAPPAKKATAAPKAKAARK